MSQVRILSPRPLISKHFPPRFSGKLGLRDPRTLATKAAAASYADRVSGVISTVPDDTLYLSD
jgi:hypothetical protein